MVETSLLFVLLIPLIVASVDMGRAYFDYDLLTHAVNEGARWASFDHNADNILSTVRTAGGGLSLRTSDVAVTCYSAISTTTKTCSLVVSGASIRVSAQVVFQPFTPVAFAMLSDGQLTLAASAQRTFE